MKKCSKCGKEKVIEYHCKTKSEALLLVKMLKHKETIKIQQGVVRCFYCDPEAKK